jgi:hypothetical protein
MLVFLYSGESILQHTVMSGIWFPSWRLTGNLYSGGFLTDGIDKFNFDLKNLVVHLEKGIGYLVWFQALKLLTYASTEGVDDFIYA